MVKQTIIKGILHGVSFILTVGIFVIGYAAWVNILTVTSSDTLTATGWNNIVNNLNDLNSRVNNINLSSSNIPSGAIMAFYLSTCPTGWKAADGENLTPDLRGQFLRGLNNFGTSVGARNDGKQDPDSRSLGNFQDDAFQNHTHRFGVQHSDNGDGMGYGLLNFNSYALNYDNWLVSPSYKTSSETRPKNIAVLYCMKE